MIPIRFALASLLLATAAVLLAADTATPSKPNILFIFSDDHSVKEWELFDNEKDPLQLRSVYDDPAYAKIGSELKSELERLRAQYKDSDELNAARPKGGAKKKRP
jgi:hypothetical protein